MSESAVTLDTEPPAPPAPPATLLLWPGFDPNHPSRYGTAYRMLLELLGDHDWHPWEQVVGPVIAATGLQRKTVAGLVHRMVRAGGVARRGRWRRPPRRDTRQLRLTRSDERTDP